MDNIKTSIEVLWIEPPIKAVKTSSITAVDVPLVEMPSPTVEFRDRTVAVSDLAVVSLTSTAVSFVCCRSKEWIEIGKRLAKLP
jgi:hypothetical protein